MSTLPPTPYQDLNAVLLDLVNSVQAILGDHFLAAYLQGSFAVGDFDVHSDVDFLIVIDQDLSEAHLAALQAMHARIYALDCPWAQHLEGSYFPQAALRRTDPTALPLFYLDNGSHELIRSQHDNTQVVRWVVREWGIPLAGPAPTDLIDPISADDLRQEIAVTMHDWAAEILAAPERMNNGWYQPYAVLSYCRMLQTLHTGQVESKRAGAMWGMEALDGRWLGLIQQAWDERPFPWQRVHQKANPDAVKNTVEFIHYALTLSSSYKNSKP